MENVEKNAKLLTEIIGVFLLVGKIFNLFLEKGYPLLHKDTQKNIWAKTAYCIFVSGTVFLSLFVLGIYTKTEMHGFLYGLILGIVTFVVEMTYKEPYNVKLTAKNNFKLFFNVSRRILFIMYVFFIMIEYLDGIVPTLYNTEWMNIMALSIYLLSTVFTICILMRFGKKKGNNFQTNPKI